MVRASASDSEPESTRSASVAKTAPNRYSAKKARRASAASPEIDDVEADEAGQPEGEDASEKDKDASEGEDDEDDDEPEYEIEKIMKAKRGYFHPGRMAYLVKWVGYSEEHNSWVDEPDAGNAEDLIQQFWRESKSQKAAAPAGRKSVGDKPAPKKNGRVSSLAREESSDNDSAAPAKKRGRPSKGGAVAAATKTKARDEDEDERAVKKARKSTTTSVATKRDKLSKKADAMDVDGDDDEDDGEPDKPIGSMKEHMSTQSWESLVKVVDTVERDDDGTIYVYFTVNGEEDVRMREPSKLCAKKFPQKLIKFYESNLRWRAGEDENENENGAKN